MRTTKTLATLTAFLLAAATADAAIVTQVHYPMGEGGSVISGLPQDTVGGYHFTGGGGGITTASPSPVSPTYANLRGNSPTLDGAYGVGYDAALPTNNFGVEMWVRSSDDNGLIFATGHTSGTGTLKFEIAGGDWRIGIVNVAGITTTENPVVPDTWTHLAYIRSGGIGRAYVNGVEYGTPTGGAPAWSSSGVLGLTNIAARNNYAGDVDDLRVFTFDPSFDDPIAALNSSPLPEPGTLALMGLGLLVIARVKKMARLG